MVKPNHLIHPSIHFCCIDPLAKQCITRVCVLVPDLHYHLSRSVREGEGSSCKVSALDGTGRKWSHVPASRVYIQYSKLCCCKFLQRQVPLFCRYNDTISSPFIELRSGGNCFSTPPSGACAGTGRTSPFSHPFTESRLQGGRRSVRRPITMTTPRPGLPQLPSPTFFITRQQERFSHRRGTHS
jgi:hypothetical protein